MSLPVARLVVTLVVAVTSVAAVSASQDRKLNRRDVEKLVAEADKLIAGGQLPDARQRLNTIVQQDPTNGAVALKLARVCESLKEWDCAGSAFQLAAANVSGPDKAEALAGLAAAHFRGGRFPDAAENARAALALNPSLAAAHVTLATSLVRSGAPEAVAAAQKAVEVAPTNVAVHLALGQALVAAKKETEAEASFRKVAELDPKSAEAHASLADIQFRRKDHDAAIASVSAALQLDKSHTRLYSIRGRAHYAKGDEEQAIGDLQTAVAINAEDRDAHLALGNIYRKRRNLDYATTHFKAASGGDVPMGEAYLGFAEALVLKRDFESAREPVEKVSAALRQNARAQYLLGALREHQRQHDAAVTAYQEAIALDPKLAPALLGLGRVLREHKKDAAGAVVNLEKAMASEPENPEVLSELGVALYETKQGDRAIQTLQKAVATPAYANAMGFAVLGLALKDRQSFADALPHFEKAVELAPKWWLPHWGAAWSHFGLIKKGCPCGEADDQRIKKMKAHYDTMTSLDGKDPALEARVDALLKGQKIK